MSTFHILNGDALKEQFPTDKIPGEIIITRECLIEGPVEAADLDEFVTTRAKYFEETYQSSEYLDHTFSELKRIAEISDGEVYLWFEEDLFCQTNLWFVCSLLYLKEVNVHLVVPKESLRYGFGGFDADGLEALFSKKQLLTKVQVNQFALLWFAYQKDNIERLLKLGVQMNTDFPFVMRAIEAHFDRIPKDDRAGKPEQLIEEIIEEKSTSEFGVIFQEFAKRAPIYGFGDLQVMRIYDAVVNKK